MAKNFSDKSARRIIDATRRLEKIPVNPRPRRPQMRRFGRQVVFIGYLLEDLSAATSMKSGATTAQAVRMTKNGLGNLVERNCVTLTNRSTSLTAEAGTMVIWTRINGENIPLWVDCLGDVSSSSFEC